MPSSLLITSRQSCKDLQYSQLVDILFYTFIGFFHFYYLYRTSYKTLQKARIIKIRVLVILVL